MNIETKVYKAKAEKLMEEVRRLETLLERQADRPLTASERAAMEAKYANPQPEPGETEGKLIEPVDFSSGAGGVMAHTGSKMAQGAVAAGSGLAGAHAVGGYVPTKIGNYLIGTPPQIVRPRPGGFSTARATQNAYDVVKGVLPYEPGAVHLGSMGSGWGTRLSDKLIRELEKADTVNKTAPKVAKAAAAFEKKFNLPWTLSAQQRETLAAAAARRAEDTYRAGSDVSKTAAKIASTEGGQVASKGGRLLTKLGAKGLGKFLTPLGAAMSGWDAYKEFEKGNKGRGWAHTALAAANFVPGVNLLAIPFEIAMAATVEESYKGIEVTKKLNEIKNL